MSTPDRDAIIQKGIISPEELHALMQSPARSPRLKILDGTFVLPGSDTNPEQEFDRAHIDGAQFFDIEAVSDKDTDLPHMLPPASQFENAISNMGIGNDDFVVVYGQSGLVMGPARVWWMFRAFGHHAVCVLDGGLSAWIKAGYPVTSEKIEPMALTSFQTIANTALLSTKKQVQRASDTKSAFILDARPAPRFNAEIPEPRPGMRSGHIENSQNVPAQSLVDAQTDKLKPVNELKDLLAPYLGQDHDIITTCGSGVTACVIALGLFNCGTKNASVYDGSWAEWGRIK